MAAGSPLGRRQDEDAARAVIGARIRSFTCPTSSSYLLQFHAINITGGTPDLDCYQIAHHRPTMLPPNLAELAAPHLVGTEWTGFDLIHYLKFIVRLARDIADTLAPALDGLAVPPAAPSRADAV